MLYTYSIYLLVYDSVLSFFYPSTRPSAATFRAFLFFLNATARGEKNDDDDDDDSTDQPTRNTYVIFTFIGRTLYSLRVGI